MQINIGTKAFVKNIKSFDKNYYHNISVACSNLIILLTKVYLFIFMSYDEITRVIIEKFRITANLHDSFLLKVTCGFIEKKVQLYKA